MKAHKINVRSKIDENLKLKLNLKIFLDFLTSKNYLFIFIGFCLFLLGLILIKNFRSCFKNNSKNFLIKLENIHENLIGYNDEDFKNLLEFNRIKHFVLNKENSLMRQKYGKDFEVELLSEKTILEDFKNFLETSEELKREVCEFKLILAEMKFYFIEIIIISIIYIVLFSTFSYLSYGIYERFGMLNLLMINMIVFAKIIFTFLVKKTFSFYFNKKEIGKIIFLNN